MAVDAEHTLITAISPIKNFHQGRPIAIVPRNPSPYIYGSGPDRLLVEGNFLLCESYRLPDLLYLLGCSAHKNNMFAWEACQACWSAKQWDAFGATGAQSLIPGPCSLRVYSILREACSCGREEGEGEERL